MWISNKTAPFPNRKQDINDMEKTSKQTVEENALVYYKGIAFSLGGHFVENEQLTWFSTGRRSVLRFNGVLWTRTAAEKLDEIALPILNHFRANHLPFFWVDFPPGATPGLGEFLQNNDVAQIAKGMPAMARSLLDAPPLPALDKVEISEVRSPRDQADWLDVHLEGSGDPPEANPDFKDFLQSSMQSLQWRHFIARQDGAPCAISTLLCAREAAGIYHVTTLPAYRGKGLGRALTLAAMQAGKVRGYSQALLFATPDGFPLYQKLGFKTVLTADLYAWLGGIL
jgi:GNAT superfamily N-acetyltransferase